MRSSLLLLAAILECYGICAQNVGIGTPAPTEKLDVNGNINVNGTIKANGVSGQARQVLTTGTSGTLEWADLSQYKNFVSYTVTGASTFTVPATVTKILVEVWGAGAGGTSYNGGSGGGYIKAQLAVTPGNSVNINVGTGGSAGALTSSAGGVSSVAAGGVTVTAQGGGGGLVTSGVYVAASSGGTSSVTAGFRQFIQSPGGTSRSNTITYDFNGTSYFERTLGVSGGNGGNTTNTGGEGTFRLKNITASTTTRIGYGADGLQPGGGGGGGAVSDFNGGDGGNGMVIIYY